MGTLLQEYRTTYCAKCSMDVFRTIKSEKNQSLLFLQIQFTLNVVYTYSVHTLWLLYFDFPLLCLYVVLQRCDHILDGIDILLLWRRELNNSTLVKCTTTTSCCYGESSIVHRFTTTTYVTGSKKRGNFAQNANFYHFSNCHHTKAFRALDFPLPLQLNYHPRTPS